MIIINHRYRLIRLICVQDSEIVIEKVDTIRYNKNRVQNGEIVTENLDTYRYDKVVYNWPCAW